MCCSEKEIIRQKLNYEKEKIRSMKVNEKKNEVKDLKYL
jgi:hypothetical protein